MGLISFGKVQKNSFFEVALTSAHTCTRARVRAYTREPLLFESFDFLKVLKKSFKKCHLFECFEKMSKNIQ